MRNVYAYGVGRAVEDADETYLKDQTKAFGARGYRYAELLTSIAASPAFFKAVLPAADRPGSASAKVAAVRDPNLKGVAR